MHTSFPLMRRLVAILLLLAAPSALGQPDASSVEARVDRLVEAAGEASPDSGRVLAAEAVALARRGGYARGVGRAEYALARGTYFMGAPEAGGLFARAARSARRAGDAKTEGYALAWQGATVAEGGDEARGRALMRSGLAVHRRQGGDEGARNALVPLNMLGFRYTETGQPDSARAVYLQIARDASRLDDPRSAALAALSLGELELARGDYAAAAQFYRQLEQTVARADLDDLATEAPLGLAKVDVALGRTDEAARTFRRLADGYIADGQKGYASYVLTLLGDLQRSEGRLAAALAAYREARSLLDDGWRGGDVYDLAVREAAVLFDLGRAAEARRVLHPAADSLVAMDEIPAQTALALVQLARDARLAGRPAEASAFARRAAATADEAGLAALTRDATVELAAALEASGDTRGALAAFRRSAALTDSLRSTEQARRVGRLEAEAAAEVEQVAVRAQRRQAQMAAGGLGLLLLLGGAGGAHYARTVRRAAREAALRTAEIARQADALEAANADLAQTNVVVREARDAQAHFFQMASHELRTPLTLTLGPIDDLRRGLHGPLDAPAQRTVDLAYDNAARLARLVDDLLDAARLDAGEVPHRPVRADLSALVRAAAGAFAGHAEREGVALTVETPDALAAVFDAPAVERSLGNLLANALRHTPRGGAVAVRLSVDTPDDRAEARVAVADTGPGVPPDALPHLFRRFYRADESVGVGTGLGLALAQEWMARHGGRVEVQSPPGAGATVTLVLPLATVAPGAETTRTARLADGSLPPDAAADLLDAPDLADDRLVVLVAEDSDDLRAYVAGHLARVGGAGFRRPVTVLQTADGADALRLALEHVPDLVVSDVMMPGLDGVALTEALKADWRTSHVPVLLLTAKADAASRVTGFQSGADGYLSKPFDAEVLRAQAAALVAERERLRRRASAPVGGDSFSSGDSRAGTEPEPPALSAADRAFLDRVDAALAAGLADATFGAERLAEALDLSPRQLRRKLGALTGDAPLARLRRARVEAGAALLRAGTHTVREAARAVGYADDEGFRRAFVAVRGALPSEATATGAALRL